MRRLLIILISVCAVIAARADDVITINSVNDLVAVRNAVNQQSDNDTYAGKTVKLMTDLDLDDSWVPIGIDDNHSFQGTFDGQGYIITINVTKSSLVLGLFGYVGSSGVVQNLRVAGRIANTETGSTTYTGGIAGKNHGTIRQCANLANIIGYYVGGIAGENHGTITNCYNQGYIGGGNGSYLGGIVGNQPAGTISYCYASCKIEDVGTKGGIFANKNGTVSNCYYDVKLVNVSNQNESQLNGSTTLTGSSLDGYLNTQKDYTIWTFTDGQLPELNRLKSYYTVQFYKNDNNITGAMLDQYFTVGVTKPLSNNTFDGKIFTGWATEANGNVVYANQESVTNLTGANTTKTLYAKWTDTYTVIFNKNAEDATGTMADQSLTYGENTQLTQLTPNAFTRTGYTFAGWNTLAAPTDESPGTSYVDQQPVQNITDVNHGTITLYAQWTPHTFANDGKLPGEFTINAGGGKVNFSHGNLQYQASTGTWRFADNQYDNIGANNANISENYEGWIDLFGWGTSGYNHGAVCYQPWSASTTNTDYYPYGSATANLYDNDGRADWGYNAISNGGNTENYGWRTPMKDEWKYLFNTRTTTSGIRYAKATVNGVTGVILLPDDWDTSYYALNNTNTANAAWTSNSISASDWTASLEAHGAVFLPTSGNRDGAKSPSSGFVSCWSSNYEVGETNYARVVYIPGDGVSPDARGQRSTGNPVRLVYEAPYFQGSGTEADPYLISSEADWNYLAGKVNTGYTFSGKYFCQTADISVTTMVGNSESNSFRGTFDGNNHTLTFTKGSSESAFNEESCAPFRHVKNASITNLQVAGSIYTSAMRASGLVATSHGALTLAGCRSSVNINSSKSGDGTHGGLVAITTGSGNNVTIDGCVFDGSFATTSSTNSCGGFVGWTGENTPAITNSLMKPGYVAAGMLNNTFARWQSGYKPTITNCYYVTTDNLPTDHGKLARSITAGTDVTISNLGAASATYNVSGITVYAHGIKYGGTYYAGNGDEVSLTLSHDKSGFSFIQYTVTGGGTLTNPTTDTPTLTMTNDNQVISATWKKLLSNTDITIADIPSQTYDGTALTPVITVTDGTTPLTQGTDYTVSPETATNTGEYEVTITGIGNYDGTATKTFTIVPQVTNYGAATITWDQTGKTATLDGVSDLPCNITVETNVNHAVLNRTFTSGKKVTICLPFVVTAEQAATLGTFYYFSGVTGEGQIEMTQETSDLTAHTPYIFEPSSGRTTFDFGEKTILTGSPLTTSFIGLKFKGIYDRVKWTANDQDALYNADRAAELGKAYGFALQDMTVGTKTYEVGQFVKLGDGAHSRAFRAYLLYDGTWDGNQPTNPASSAPRRSDVTLPDVIEIVWKDADGNVTGISALDTRCGEMADYGTDWYTVDGRKLDGKPATKGLYINNGRKVVVK